MCTIPFRGGAEVGDVDRLTVDLGGDCQTANFDLSAYDQEPDSPSALVQVCLPLILAKAACGGFILTDRHTHTLTQPHSHTATQPPPPEQR